MSRKGRASLLIVVADHGISGLGSWIEISVWPLQSHVRKNPSANEYFLSFLLRFFPIFRGLLSRAGHPHDS